MNDLLEIKTQYIWENGSYKSRKEMTMYLSIDNNDATTKNYFAINKIGRKTSIKLVKIEDENVKEFRKVNIDNHIRKLLIESLKAYKKAMNLHPLFKKIIRPTLTPFVHNFLEQWMQVHGLFVSL